MTPIDPASANSVPALARTDVRPAVPEQPRSRRRSAGRALLVGAAVLVAVALLVFGLVFALRHGVVDPALLSTDLLDVLR